MTGPGPLVVRAVDGIGEVTAGTDLTAILVRLADPGDGDVVVVTSKVVSKAEGRVVRRDRAAAIADETVRVVARRGETAIVENRLGLVMAAAGVDSSNVAVGHVVLLPEDPDASARRLRTGVLEQTGRNVAVIVSDTAGRAWRNGQTDIAIGVAGLQPLQEFAGQVDEYGNPLAVTAPAVADEIAGIAEVVTGKLGGRPVTVLTGLADRVLPPGEHGAGARALVRPRSTDMFGLGAREAVVAALSADHPGASPSDGDGFGAPATSAELLSALTACSFVAEPARSRLRVLADPADPVLRAVATAHGWGVVPQPEGRPETQTGEPATLLAPLS